MPRSLTADGIARAAAIVAEAYRANAVIDAFPDELMPATVDEARAIQDRLAETLGPPVVGWKVGHGNPAMRQRFGDAVPVLGRLFAGMIVPTPATVSASIIHNPFVEGELAVRMGRDLPPRAAAYSAEEVVDAIDALMPAIEFAEVRSRNVDDMTVLSLAAFNAGAFRLVLGPEIDDWRSKPILRCKASLRLDGRLVATEYTDDQRTDYVWVMHFLANDLSRRGIGLHAGEIVSTGVVLKYLPLGDAREAIFRFEGCADVTLSIVD